MKISALKEIQSNRDYIDTFGGYNHTESVGQAEFYDMKNMSGKDYPTLSPRERRRIDRDPTRYINAMVNINNLEITVENHSVWARDYTIPTMPVEVNLGLTLTPKQLIMIGSYLIIMPDRKYVNCGNIASFGTDYGSIENLFQTNATTGKITASICNEKGEILTVASGKPESPEDGDLWIEINGSSATNDRQPILVQWFEQSQAAIEVPSYIRLEDEGETIGKGFSVGEFVELNGFGDGFYLDLKKRNGTKVEIIKAEYDETDEANESYIVISGCIDIPSITSTGETIRVERTMPAMDYIIESGNRLWGCRFDGNINEIYASKLGDFKTWYSFKGISTDSYVASCGTPGEWTGAVSYQGSPYFFKENVMHKVYGGIPSSMQIQTTECKGVERNAWRSLVVVNNVLYYKSKEGVCAFNGSLPTVISDKLGDTFNGFEVVEEMLHTNTYGASAGGIRDKYFISMRSNITNEWSLFAYDTKKGLWHKEDDLFCKAFYTAKNSLLAKTSRYYNLCTIDARDGMFELYDLEDPVEWMIETGDIVNAATKYGTSHSADKKYVSRVNIRLNLEIGAKVCLYVKYDNKGEWQHFNTMMGTVLRSCSIGIRPRRCDNFRIRLVGTGDANIHSIAKTIEIGSDR